MRKSKIKEQKSKLPARRRRASKIQNFKFLIVILIFAFCILNLCYAQEAEIAIVDTLEKSRNVTLDFKEADIRNVLKIISYKSGVNIVATPEVIGNISIRLVDVPWEKALDAILKTYGFAYEKIGNIITVAPIDKLTSLKKQEVELAQVQPTVSEVFNLKYIDAQDAKKAIEPQLSPRGKITVLEMTRRRLNHNFLPAVKLQF